MRTRSLWWLGILAMVGAMAVGVVYVRADEPEPMSAEAAVHLQHLQDEQEKIFNVLQSVAVDNPSEWSFAWLDHAKHVMQGSFPGFDSSLGSSLVYTWTKKVSKQFHEPGDYLPLFILRKDGTEARVALYKHDGSIQVIRMVPKPFSADAHTNWLNLEWEVTVSEVR